MACEGIENELKVIGKKRKEKKIKVKPKERKIR